MHPAAWREGILGQTNEGSLDSSTAGGFFCAWAVSARLACTAPGVLWVVLAIVSWCAPVPAGRRFAPGIARCLLSRPKRQAAVATFGSVLRCGCVAACLFHEATAPLSAPFSSHRALRSDEVWNKGCKQFPEGSCFPGAVHAASLLSTCLAVYGMVMGGHGVLDDQYFLFECHKRRSFCFRLLIVSIVHAATACAPI